MSNTQTHRVRITKTQRPTQRQANRSSVPQARWERDKKTHQNKVGHTNTQLDTQKHKN